MFKLSNYLRESKIIYTNWSQICLIFEVKRCFFFSFKSIAVHSVALGWQQRPALVAVGASPRRWAGPVNHSYEAASQAVLSTRGGTKGGAWFTQGASQSDVGKREAANELRPCCKHPFWSEQHFRYSPPSKWRARSGRSTRVGRGQGVTAGVRADVKAAVHVKITRIELESSRSEIYSPGTQLSDD